MIEALGYAAVLLGGGYLAFMAGFVLALWVGSFALEDALPALSAGGAALVLWVIAFMWWIV
ncbi:hypothetical protein [Sediminimonas sp.]|uniref:hypothetical protein n=1 Tax=Sediminimonas sp. TaxID=2823379 RepID=UPI0025F8B7D9|nr:hypothetical protein [Sediminimonas sp.]